MLHKDDWLSGYFGGGAYAYKAPYAPCAFPDGFVYAKIPAQDTATVRHLCGQGFGIAEVAVQFVQRKKAESHDDAGIIRPSGSADEPGVLAIARDAFRSSRLYADPLIPDETASAIKEAWVANYFKGRRGDRMYVAEQQGKIAGFLLLAGQTIDLIAVAPDCYKKGIARAMISRANEEVGLLTAGTQITNAASLALYEKSGFMLESAAFVLHRHGGFLG